MSTDAARATARRITDTVESLDKHLADLIRTAETARAALTDGTNVPGMFSVLGNTPTHIEQDAATLRTLITLAGPIGLDHDALNKAYADGAKPWHER